MRYSYFIFNGHKYYSGTIVKVSTSHEKEFGFYSCVSFVYYDDKKKQYCFKSLYNNHDYYCVKKNMLNTCIESVKHPVDNYKTETNKVNANYVDGIVSAWIWYLVAMFGGLFISGPFGTAVVWSIASFVFFSWRNNKMKGG